MTVKKGFSKKDLADQNAKVLELGKEENKLISSIERGERTLAENREKLKDVQKQKSAENTKLEQMIQRGIKAASKGESGKRAALIAALLMTEDDEEEDDDGKQKTPQETPAVTPTPSPTSTLSTPVAAPTLPLGSSSQDDAADDENQNQVA